MGFADGFACILLNCIGLTGHFGQKEHGSRHGQLGPPVVPFSPFLGEGSRTKIDDRKNRAPLF